MHRLLAGLTVALVLLTACTPADEVADGPAPSQETESQGPEEAPTPEPTTPPGDGPPAADESEDDRPSPSSSPSPSPSPSSDDDPPSTTGGEVPGHEAPSMAEDEAPAASENDTPTPVPCPADEPAEFGSGPGATPDDPRAGTATLCGVRVHYDLQQLYDVGRQCGERSTGEGCWRAHALLMGCCIHGSLVRPGVAYAPDGRAVEVPDDWAAHLASFPWLDVRVLEGGSIAIESTDPRATEQPVAEGLAIFGDGDRPSRAVLRTTDHGFVVWATRGSIGSLQRHVHLIESEIWFDGRFDASPCPLPADAVAVSIGAEPRQDDGPRQRSFEACGVPVELDVPEGMGASYFCGLIDDAWYGCRDIHVVPEEGIFGQVVRPRFVWDRHGRAIEPPTDWAEHLRTLEWIDVREHPDGTLGIRALNDGPHHRRLGDGMFLGDDGRAQLKPVGAGFVVLVMDVDPDDSAVARKVAGAVRIDGG